MISSLEMCWPMPYTKSLQPSAANGAMAITSLSVCLKPSQGQPSEVMTEINEKQESSSPIKNPPKINPNTKSNIHLCLTSHSVDRRPGSVPDAGCPRVQAMISVANY